MASCFSLLAGCSNLYIPHNENIDPRSEAEIDPRTRMLSVVARIPNPYRLLSNSIPLKVGLYVNADIKGKKLRDVVILPRHVIYDKDLVWVTNKEGILSKREIQIIREDGDRAFIKEGLFFGDEILMTRLGVIIDGMQVRMDEERRLN